MSSNNQLPSVEYLRQVLEYNPETGIFIWKNRSVDMFIDGKQSAHQSCSSWNAKYANRIASGYQSKGYVYIGINSRNFLAHRVAWKFYYGDEPPRYIDHIDGNKKNNAIKNLREATQSQNNANSKKFKNNTSGYKGIIWDKSRNKWQVKVQFEGKTIHFGRFNDLESAIKIHKDAFSKLYGEYARFK